MDVTVALAGIWVSYHGGGCLANTGNMGFCLQLNPQVNINTLYLNHDVYRVMYCTCRIFFLPFTMKESSMSCNLSIAESSEHKII